MHMHFQSYGRQHFIFQWLIWDIVPKSLWNHYMSVIHSVLSSAYVSSPASNMANHRDIVFGKYMYLYVILMHIKY